MAEILGGGDDHGPADGGFGVGAQPVGGAVAERQVARDLHLVGVTRLQELAPLVVAHDVADRLAMRPGGDDVLRTLGVAVDQLGIGERQDALGHLLQGAVVEFTDLVLQEMPGGEGGGEP